MGHLHSLEEYAIRRSYAPAKDGHTRELSIHVVPVPLAA